jgi:translation initiation factor IF-2
VVEEKKVETPKVEAEPENQEPQKIETVYQNWTVLKLLVKKLT